jgi:hypothetical protein
LLGAGQAFACESEGEAWFDVRPWESGATIPPTTVLLYRRARGARKSSAALASLIVRDESSLKLVKAVSGQGDCTISQMLTRTLSR